MYKNVLRNSRIFVNFGVRNNTHQIQIYYEILTTLIILIVWQNTKSNISINLILIVLVNSSPDFSLKSEEALHLKDRKKFSSFDC